MKTVTLVVEIVVQVPNETNSTLLHLNNSLEDFRVEEGGTPVDGNVTGYTTVDVIDDNETAEIMDDEG